MTNRNGHTPTADADVLDLTPYLPATTGRPIACGDKTYWLSGDYLPSFVHRCMDVVDRIDHGDKSADDEAYEIAAEALKLPVDQVRAEIGGVAVLVLLRFLLTGRGPIRSTLSSPKPSASEATTESAPESSSDQTG